MTRVSNHSPPAGGGSPEIEFEIFRAGDYGERGAWGDDSLDALVRDYDPALHEAPVTFDHAQTGPALGWVAGLRRSGDRLLARVRAAGDDLLDALREGSFRKRSVELYRALPETGRPYLKAVSLLGAAAPAVKGLRDPLFAEDADYADLFAGEEAGARGERSDDGDEADRGRAPIAPPSASLRFDATGASEASAAAIPIAFAEVERELRRTGRWRPAWGEGGVREIHAALARLDGSANREDSATREDGRAPLADRFADLLRSLPPLLPVGEVGRFGAGVGEAVGFGEDDAFPVAPNVDPRSVELHRRASALRRARPGLGYGEALIAASRG